MNYLKRYKLNIDKIDKIFLVLLIFFVGSFIIIASSSVGNVLEAKKIIALEPTFSLSKSAAYKEYKTQLKSLGIKNIDLNNVSLVNKGDKNYTFEAIADNGKKCIIEIQYTANNVIKKVNVNNRHNLSRLVAIENNQQQFNEAKWQIQDWVVNSEKELNINQLSRDDKEQVKINKLVNFSVESTTTPVSLESVDSTSPVTFEKDNITYSVFSKKMDLTYKTNTDVNNVVNSWKENSNEFFKSINASETVPLSTIYTWTNYNQKKYPTVISSIKYENDTLVQENLISIIYFPKDEIELIIIGNKITYKQPIEDKTKNEDTELSEPINSETTPLDDREEINRDVVNNASQTNTTNVSTPQTLSIFDNYFEISNQFSLSFINPTKIPLSYSLNML